MTITDITTEQLAVLIGFCRREAHRGEYMTPEVLAVVEAVSGPCFAEADEFGYRAPLNSDGSEA
jgi:hypothetical protein